MGPELPKAIGRYAIDRVIGRGAMSIVYGAHDPATRKPVAIKLIRADLVDGDDRADFVARFCREAQTAGRCRHLNIVSVFDVALHEGNPYITRAMVVGSSLVDAIGRERFAAAAAVSFGGQVLSALACAHDLGIVHRGIKPANIFRLPDGTVKVTDFGISRAGAGASAITQSGAMIGTPSYMSPEQCRGEDVDARSDLFSLGSLLYEMVSGEKPFVGRSMTHVMARLLGEDPDDLATKVPDLPPDLVAVIHQALSKSPAERFPSATAMATALAASVGNVPEPESSGTISDRASASHAGISPQDIERVTGDLAFYLGPIAKVLVRHTLPTVASLSELRRKLAGQSGERGRPRHLPREELEA